MIHIPPHVVSGQVLSADFLNRLIDALRAVRPIQGQGILLRETPQGVVIEATAKTVQATRNAPAAAVKTLPFTLRVREEGGPFLDIYDPQGTAQRFLTEAGNSEMVESAWETPLAKAPDDGWHTFGKLADLTFDGTTNTCTVRLDLSQEDTFALSDGTTAAGEASVIIGIVTRSGKGTEAEPYTYAITQRVAGAFRRAYVWLGAEGLFVQNGSTLTDALDSVTWTRTTNAFLCRLYGLTVDFPEGGQLVLSNPCAEQPTAQDGKPVFASKLAAKSHAADHLQDFIPFDEVQ